MLHKTIETADIGMRINRNSFTAKFSFYAEIKQFLMKILNISKLFDFAMHVRRAEKQR